MKAQGVFRKCGENVMITSRKIPLYSKLISIGNNVWMASGVSFLTHDVVHFMLNRWRPQNEPRFEEKVGCIEIGDNVFIGANTTILYDVKIGNNVVIGSNTLVNKDIPDNTVVGGVPVRVLGSFEELVKKRREIHFEHSVDNGKQSVSSVCEEELWNKFYMSHRSKNINSIKNVID